jgi:hypothetical protein
MLGGLNFNPPQTDPMPEKPNAGPRSPSAPRKPRTLIKCVRFSASEWAKVNDKLGGAEFGAVVRYHLLHIEVPPRSIRRTPASEFELRKAALAASWGNNLNQIARRVNSSELSRSAEILSALLELQELLEKNLGSAE